MFQVVMISVALALRQMSMTIVSPFISTYCKELTGYTPLLTGFAVGAFGLMQAIFQIPFGILSDRHGNKKVMVVGLILVVVGLIIAYFAPNIWLLIFARSLQGSGAILGVGYSWISGITDKNHQSQAMSILGAFVSASAALAFAAGPLLREIMTVNQMFLIGAVLLAANTLYIMIFLPDSKKIINRKKPGELKETLYKLIKDRCFVKMNLAAFINNFMMMAVFFAAPINMDHVTGQKGMWKIFVPAIIIAIIFMKCMVKYIGIKYVDFTLVISFIMTSIAILFYFNSNSFSCLLVGTTIYLSGYVTTATVSAARVNQLLNESLRGTGNGVFNSFQYIGNFAGALTMGICWNISQFIAWSIIFVVGLIAVIIQITYK